MIDEPLLISIARRCRTAREIIHSTDDQAYLDRFRLKCYKDIIDKLLVDPTGQKLVDLLDNMAHKNRLKNAVKATEEQEN